MERPFELPLDPQTRSVLLFFDLKPRPLVFAADAENFEALPLTLPSSGALIVLQYQRSLLELGIEPGWLNLLPQEPCALDRPIPPASSILSSPLEALDWTTLQTPPAALSGYRLPPFAWAACAEQGWFRRTAEGPLCTLEPAQRPAIVAPMPLNPALLPSLCDQDPDCAAPLRAASCEQERFSPQGAACAQVGTDCEAPGWPSPGPRMILVPAQGGPSLAQAMRDAQPGDTLLIEPGEHSLGDQGRLEKRLTLWGACAKGVRLRGRILVLGGLELTLRNLTVEQDTVEVHEAPSHLVLEDVIVDGQGSGQSGLAITATARITRSLIKGWEAGLLVDGGGAVEVVDSELRNNRLSAARCLSNLPGVEESHVRMQRVRLHQNSMSWSQQGGVPIGALELHSGERGCAAHLEGLLLSENSSIGLFMEASTATVTELVAVGNQFGVAVVGQAQLHLDRALIAQSDHRGLSINQGAQADCKNLTILDSNLDRASDGFAVHVGADAFLRLERARLHRYQGLGLLLIGGQAEVHDLHMLEQGLGDETADDGSIKAEKDTRLTLERATIERARVGVLSRDRTEISLKDVFMEQLQGNGLQVYVDRPGEQPQVRLERIQIQGAAQAGLHLRAGQVVASDVVVSDCGIGLRSVEEYIGSLGETDQPSQVSLQMSGFELLNNEIAISVDQLVDGSRLQLVDGYIADNKVAYRLEQSCEPLPDQLIEGRVFFKDNSRFMSLPQK